MAEHAPWEINENKYFHVSIFPLIPPVIDFHIKQTFTLILFLDTAQRAYWLRWTATDASSITDSEMKHVPTIAGYLIIFRVWSMSNAKQTDRGRQTLWPYISR